MRRQKLRTRKGGVSGEYVADFETTTDPNDCRVWLWAVASITDKKVIDRGTDLQSFIHWCTRNHGIVHFHNLRFDGMFILYWLLSNGYTHAITYPRLQQFTTMISKEGMFYSIKVHWGNGVKTDFRDSMKKLPMPVSAIAKSFKLDIMKGEIDYDAPRPVGYVPTSDEIDYVENDVLIVAQSLAVQQSQGLIKLTVGSDALGEFTCMLGDDYRRFYPELSEMIDYDIRRAYRGGFTYADPRFQGRVLGPGHVYDVNSLYPSVMYDRLLPYGHPRLIFGKPPSEGLWVACMTITAKLKPNHIPCIPITSGTRFGKAAVYTDVIAEPTQFSMTNVDWNLWNDHYDIEVWSYDNAWAFDGVAGMFKDYIDKWSTVKAESEGGLRELAKLMLNSLYGKFATSTDVTGKIPCLVESKDFDRPIVSLRMGEDERRDPVYTPVGVFVTAYARDVTIRAAQGQYDRFAYCDTDSLHLMGDEEPTELDVDPTRMGAWKHEMHFDAAWFERAKCYTERTHDGAYHTHIAGLPRETAAKVTFEDYLHPKVHEGKLAPRRVPGGVVLIPVPFTLNTLLDRGANDHGTQDREQDGQDGHCHAG